MYSLCPNYEQTMNKESTCPDPLRVYTYRLGKEHIMKALELRQVYQVNTPCETLEDLTNIINTLSKLESDSGKVKAYFLNEAKIKKLTSGTKYKNVPEYAADVYGIGKAQAYKYIAVAERFLNSPTVSKFANETGDFTISQLTTFVDLNLPDSTIAEIPFTMTVREIKEKYGKKKTVEATATDNDTAEEVKEQTKEEPKTRAKFKPKNVFGDEIAAKKSILAAKPYEENYTIEPAFENIYFKRTEKFGGIIILDRKTGKTQYIECEIE